MKFMGLSYCFIARNVNSVTQLSFHNFLSKNVAEKAFSFQLFCNAFVPSSLIFHHSHLFSILNTVKTSLNDLPIRCKLYWCWIIQVFYSFKYAWDLERIENNVHVEIFQGCFIFFAQLLPWNLLFYIAFFHWKEDIKNFTELTIAHKIRNFSGIPI